jgi:transcriptional antiterminator RfaH
MPVLPAEPNIFPEALLTEEHRQQDSGRAWWVLHTRPRQEKSLARQLHQWHIPFYLPLTKHRWRLRGRTMCSHVPLFAGYVFLWADPQERLASLVPGRVVRPLEVVDQDRLAADLRQIRLLILSDLPIAPEDRLVPGNFVEIRNGPLAGLRGKIVEFASRRRFVVQVDFIKRGASVWLDDYDLEKIEPD